MFLYSRSKWVVLESIQIDSILLHQAHGESNTGELGLGLRMIINVMECMRSHTQKLAPISVTNAGF